MPTKNTTIVSARVPDVKLAEINQRITKRKMTLNQWLNWAILNGLRSHKKRTAP